MKPNFSLFLSLYVKVLNQNGLDMITIDDNNYHVFVNADFKLNLMNLITD